MVAAGDTGIANGIALVNGNFRMRFIGKDRGKISGGMFSRDPIGSHAELGVDGLLDSKLPPGSLGIGGEHIFTGVISPKG